MTKQSLMKDQIKQFDHFIPVPTKRLIKALESGGLELKQIQVMHYLKQLLSVEYQQKLETLKQCYLPFDPDSELLVDSTLQPNAEKTTNAIRDILTAANYSELNQQQIQYALEKTSPYGLKISIDFELFDQVSLYYRGMSQKTIQSRDWKTLFLRKKTSRLINYQRLFLLIRYKDQAKKPGIHLKLFRDILRPDLEMLFPESKVSMKIFDKIKLGITGGGGAAAGLFATITKITAAASPWSIVVALAGFALLIWRQISKVFIQRTRYMATLAQNLYFHSLDNNTGSLTYLIDQAQQEEIKESLLSYALINLQSLQKSDDVDTACEAWLTNEFDVHVDFDIEDALSKLERYNVISRADGEIHSENTDLVLKSLKQRWNLLLDKDL